MQVIVDGLLTRYDVKGQGNLVLFLHGWGDTAHGLAAVCTGLIENYQVIGVDLPGFGGSQLPKEAWNLDNYSEFLKHFLEKLNLPQPYAVIGHSNGGAIAIRAIALKDLKPQRLILLAPAGIRDNRRGKQGTFRVIAKIGNLATIWLPAHYRQSLRKTLYDTAGSDMLVIPGLEATFKKTVRQDVQADAATLHIPTLLIFAENDRAVPLDHARIYHRLIQGSSLEIIKDAGHFVHVDQPAKVMGLIGEFLQ